MQSVGNASDLRLLHLEDFASHYARTLAEWRKRFNDEKERILQLGYDERFCRMWEFYLAYCEVADKTPRIIPDLPVKMRLSGLEPFTH